MDDRQAIIEHQFRQLPLPRLIGDAVEALAGTAGVVLDVALLPLLPLELDFSRMTLDGLRSEDELG